MIFTPAFMKKFVVPMGLLMIGFDIGVFIIAFVKLHWLPQSAMIYAAYTCILGAAMAIWVSAAIIVNDAFGKTMIPLFGPMIKSK